MVAEETPEARAETIFKIMDLNSDGRITRLYERRQTQIKIQKQRKSPGLQDLAPQLRSTQMEGLPCYIAKDKTKLNLVKKYGFQFKFIFFRNEFVQVCSNDQNLLNLLSPNMRL